jgi:hypothetical protein
LWKLIDNHDCGADKPNNLVAIWWPELVIPNGTHLALPDFRALLSEFLFASREKAAEASDRRVLFCNIAAAISRKENFLKRQWDALFSTGSLMIHHEERFMTSTGDNSFLKKTTVLISTEPK